MSIKEGFIKEIEIETKKTKQIIESFKDEHLDYSPHAKSMTVKDLASHVVELHNWIHQAATKDAFDFHVDYQKSQDNTVQEILNTLNNGLDLNKKAIESFTDEDWTKNWSLKAGDHVIATLPRVAAMRYILLNHMIHHRGQLTVYLRLLNLPVPGIYGPSADDK